MKELDVLLGTWLDRHWSAADEAERRRFARFLELPDPEIAGYLLRDDVSAGEFEPLVRQLRGLRSGSG
jgi:succinate dehydrogenase flavin-adding protein (antitoxin of CptAB toxin-antitoxin module)